MLDERASRRPRRCPAGLLLASSLAVLVACRVRGGEADAAPAQPTVAPTQPAAPPRLAPSLAALGRTATGTRVPLADAQLFVPEGFAVPAGGAVPLAVHFQGGVVIAEENFVRSGLGGVLLASTLAGLSSAFSRPYEDPAAFRALLASAEAALSTPDLAVRFDPIVITFFSAGYGAVRQFLKDPELFARIDALVSADSIYADIAAPHARAPRVEQMVDFLRFAQAAARGEKVFVLAHGRGPTPYASTAECADLVLASVAGTRAPAGWTTERGVPVASEAHVGGLHLYTFEEGAASEEDAKRIHMDCLYAIPELVRRHVAPR